MSLLQHAITRAGEALRCVQGARRAHGASIPHAISRFVELYGPRRYSIAEIDALDLLDPTITRAVLDRRQSKEAQLGMQLRLNPREYWPRTENKIEFERHCRRVGLAVPRSFGTLEFARNGRGDAARCRADAARVLAAAPAARLIVKPVEGVYGRGVHALAAADGAFVCHDGRRRTADEVCDWIERSSDFDQYLVQERIAPHPELARLSGTDSLQTVRMVTYVGGGGDVTIGNCQLRVIVGESPVDNYCGGRTGNLLCDIPLACGRVSRAIGPADAGRRFVPVERHPRTGATLAGFEVPFWDAACRLVRDAATAFLPLRTIGWDVGIAADGPILIEGNVTWDPAYEGSVGGEILSAIIADERRRPPGASLPSAAPR
jgi:hypothetical protein